MLNKKNGLSRYRIGKLMRCLCVDLTASQAAVLLGLNRKTVNRYYGLFRVAIAAAQERDLAAFSGIVEVDESFFGAERVRGHLGPRKRGGGNLKQPVFGIFERGGRVYTEVIPDAKAPTLRTVIRGHIALDAVLVTDGWPGYNGLVDEGYDPRGEDRQHRSDQGQQIQMIEDLKPFPHSGSPQVSASGGRQVKRRGRSIGASRLTGIRAKLVRYPTAFRNHRFDRSATGLVKEGVGSFCSAFSCRVKKVDCFLAPTAAHPDLSPGTQCPRQEQRLVNAPLMRNQNQILSTLR